MTAAAWSKYNGVVLSLLCVLKFISYRVLYIELNVPILMQSQSAVDLGRPTGPCMRELPTFKRPLNLLSPEAAQVLMCG